METGDSMTTEGSMATDDNRRLIEAYGTHQAPHGNLDPVVEAELAWGNSIERDWRVGDPHLMDWTLVLAEPFHLDLLRETFRFAPGIRIGAFPGTPHGLGPRLTMTDPAYTSIISPLPAGWPDERRTIEL